jgi:hypothetical protein
MESKSSYAKNAFLRNECCRVRRCNSGDIDGMIPYLMGIILNRIIERVVGDNPNDINDTKYGNNNVMGPDKEKISGTHVAGIVAQVRNNNIGGDGIANNVEILTVRAVPDGDEYDKDIAWNSLCS